MFSGQWSVGLIGQSVGAKRKTKFCGAEHCPRLPSEEEEPDEEQHREHKGQGEAENVGHETGSMGFLMIGDGFDEEIWAVADVGVGAEEDGADADGFKALDLKGIIEG